MAISVDSPSGMDVQAHPNERLSVIKVKDPDISLVERTD
jgi:hypothetical protein